MTTGEGPDLSPEHAHVLSAFQQSLNDTIVPFREEVRVGMARQSEQIKGLHERLDANDQATREAGLAVARLQGAAEAADPVAPTESLLTKARAAVLTAIATAITTATAWFSGYFDQ